jgi:hypothetical protein
MERDWNWKQVRSFRVIFTIHRPTHRLQSTGARQIPSHPCALACPPKVAGNHTGQLSSTVALIHTATLNYLIVRTLVNISWRQSTPIQHLGYRIVPVVYRQPLSPIHRFGSSPTQPTLTLQGW